MKTPEFLTAVAAQKTGGRGRLAVFARQGPLHRSRAAGLIRDKPELIKLEKLYAHFGRGGALMYALDENNAPIW